jgi:hypothetical protein
MAAGSLAKASVHEPVGPGPLWKHKGWQLPAYIQHIANDLREKRGMTESRAIATAIAAVKRWAAGGGNVDADTRAAAAKAVAEWEKLKAKAHATSAAKKALSEDDADTVASYAVLLDQIDSGEVEDTDDVATLDLAQINIASLRRLDAIEAALLEYIKIETDPNDLLEAQSLLARVSTLKAHDKAEQANGGPMGLSEDDIVLCELFLTDAMDFAIEDGVMWKTIMREGQWKLSPGPGQKPVEKPITVVKDGVSDPQKLVISMSELIQNFKDGAIEHVSIPTSHENKVIQNTGFIRDLRLKKDAQGRWMLQGATDFTEPDVKGMAERGTIANISAGVLFDYLRKEDGKKFGAVLEHAALTNKPWLSGMTPFGMADEGTEVTVMTFSEEIDQLELSADEDEVFSNEELEALMMIEDDAAADGEADVALAQKAKKPYGNVTYADPGYQEDGKARYPVDTEEHVRAAWAYISKAKNAAAYSASQLSKIKGRIRAAMKRHGIQVAMSDDQLTAENEFTLAALLSERNADTSEGGATSMDKDNETPVVEETKTPEEIVAETLGLSIEEAKAAIEENAKLKAEGASAAITAKVEAWTEEKKSPALLAEAEKILRGGVADGGVNLSEDDKTVTLSIADVVERLVAVSPAINLDEEQVTEEDSTKGTAPDKDEEVELSDEIKSEARRLFLYEGKTAEEALELAKAAAESTDE